MSVTLEAIRAAAPNVYRFAVRTPLVRLYAGEPAEIYLKLENLQPIGAFKIRGAANAMAHADASALARGVYTASAGNMAQGVAWCARELGVRCRVIVPDTAPETKLAAIAWLGGEVIKVPFDDWWRTFQERSYPGIDGLFIHAFDDDHVMAGNGTIGLEILEDLPAVNTVVAPWGGGGLACGIAAAVKAVQPSVRVLAAEVATAAPLSASLAAGAVASVDYTPSFVDGIGSKTVVASMLALSRGLVDGAVVAGLDEVADAVRVLVERNRVVAEGAGACPVACALAGRAGVGKIVCVVSGGNINSAKLAEILGKPLGVSSKEPRTK